MLDRADVRVRPLEDVLDLGKLRARSVRNGKERVSLASESHESSLEQKGNRAFWYISLLFLPLPACPPISRSGCFLTGLASVSPPSVVASTCMAPSESSSESTIAAAFFLAAAVVALGFAAAAAFGFAAALGLTAALGDAFYVGIGDGGTRWQQRRGSAPLSSREVIAPHRSDLRASPCSLANGAGSLELRKLDRANLLESA